MTTVEEPVRALEQPVSFGGRTFPVGCPIVVHQLVPLGHGVELVPLLDQIDGIRSDQAAWAYQLRQPLVPLTEADHALVARRLATITGTSPAESGYLRWWNQGVQTRT